MGRVLVIRVPYYIGDLKRNPIFEHYPGDELWSWEDSTAFWRLGVVRVERSRVSGGSLDASRSEPLLPLDILMCMRHRNKHKLAIQTVIRVAFVAPRAMNVMRTW